MLVFYKKDGLDPSQYVDVLRALHITGSIMTDAIMALAKMEIIQRQDAIATAYKVIQALDDVAKNKQFSVVDQGDKFVIFIRR